MIRRDFKMRSALFPFHALEYSIPGIVLEFD